MTRLKLGLYTTQLLTVCCSILITSSCDLSSSSSYFRLTSSIWWSRSSRISRFRYVCTHTRKQIYHYYISTSYQRGNTTFHCDNTIQRECCNETQMNSSPAVLFLARFFFPLPHWTVVFVPLVWHRQCRLHSSPSVPWPDLVLRVVSKSCQIIAREQCGKIITLTCTSLKKILIMSVVKYE